MQLPYFPRYKKKEDVDTSNTMLMLSHLYNYDSNKFYTVLNDLVLESEDLPELTIKIHSQGKGTIPDAFIYQRGFELAIETKLNNNFNIAQLQGHLKSFSNLEEIKVLLTIDPNPMNIKLKKNFDEYLEDYNKINKTLIKHVNITFNDLINAIENVIDDHDTKISLIFEDFKNYCLEENLISDKEYWLRAVTTGKTYEDNLDLGLYYDLADRYSNDRGYIGLYKEKKVGAVGKIKKIIRAVYQDNVLKCTTILGEKVTKEEKNRITKAIERSKKYNYNLTDQEHDYFIVDNFIKTNFKKSSKNPIYKCKLFNLKKMLALKETTSTEEIANLLNNRTWEEFY